MNGGIMWKYDDYDSSCNCGFRNCPVCRGIFNRTLTRWTVFCSVLFFSLVFMSIFGCVKSGYEWDLLAGSQWELADRSSTLETKSHYINAFVLSLESMDKNGMLSEYNALFLKTPQNKTENNISAIKTLKSRLEEVSLIDFKSFEYNQAIHQITAQEQGESNELIYDLRGAFLLGSNYWYVWDWIGISIIVFEITLFLGIIILILIRIMND